MEPVIFMLCLTLHNTEEALWLTQWSDKNRPNTKQKNGNQIFIFAALGITVLGYLSGGLFLLYPHNDLLHQTFLGFVASMMINTIVPHLAGTIRYKSYCPGVITGCFLLLPFGGITLYNAWSTRFTASEMIVATLIVGAILLVCIPLFKAIGKILLRDLLSS